MMVLRIIAPALAAISLALAHTGLSVAQERFYPMRIDPSSADAHVAGHPDARVGDEPFWVAAERYIGQEGYCRLADDTGPDRVTSLEFSTIYQALAQVGFTDTLPWFVEQGLYPFGEITLDVADRRAPSGFPIFCSVTPRFDVEDLRGRLRPLFFDFNADPDSNRAYIFARAHAPEDEQEDMRRIILGAPYTLAELWDYGWRAELELFDMELNWMHTAAYDALAVAAARSEDRLFFDAYDDIEQRLPFLQGAYHQRLARPGTLGVDDSRGAFIRFLMEFHTDDGWVNLQHVLETGMVADDILGEVDLFIDSQDEELRGLEHAFPAFVADQASLGYLYAQASNGSLTMERWLADSFGDCQDARVSEASPTYSRTLTIEPYAARCIVIRAEADRAPWHGDLHMRTQLTGLDPEDSRNNRIFLSMAGRGEGSLADGMESACFTNVEEDGDGRSCIKEPSAQGRDSDERFQRYYHFEIGERTPAQEQWIIALISYVPKPDQNGSAPDFPAAQVEVTLSVDAVLGGEGALADMGPSASAEFELYDASTATINHGSKVGAAPIMARPSGTATDRDSILDGTASPVDSEMLNLGMAMADNLLQFIDDAGDGFSLILNDAGILNSGLTGSTTEFTGVVSKDGFIGMPDPEFEGRIEIIENTPDTLHFIAEEGFCMLPQDQYLSLIQRTNGDICEAGQRVTARGEGMLAFPPTRRSETQIEPVETEEYRALRNFRIERINRRLQTGAFDRQPAPLTSVRAPGSTAPTQQAPVPNSGGTQPVLIACPVLDPAGACDCSCEAKACLQTRMEAGAATAQDRSCRLTCGRAWMQCPAP